MRRSRVASGSERLKIPPACWLWVVTKENVDDYEQYAFN